MITSVPLIRHSIGFSLSLMLVLGTAIPLNGGLSDDILKYTNQYRRSKGLPKLEMLKDLNEIARKHSEDMAKGRRGFGHGGYDRRVMQAEKVVHSFHGMAENVAYGAQTAKEAFLLWKNSGSHRKNLLGNYKYTGIGTARSRNGTIFYTQLFVR